MSRSSHSKGCLKGAMGLILMLVVVVVLIGKGCSGEGYTFDEDKGLVKATIQKIHQPEKRTESGWIARKFGYDFAWFGNSGEATMVQVDFTVVQHTFRKESTDTERTGETGGDIRMFSGYDIGDQVSLYYDDPDCLVLWKLIQPGKEYLIGIMWDTESEMYEIYQVREAEYPYDIIATGK